MSVREFRVEQMLERQKEWEEMVNPESVQIIEAISALLSGPILTIFILYLVYRLVREWITRN